MKIFLADKIREADAFTIKYEPISSIDLMERASNKFVDEFMQLNLPLSKNIKVFSGMGNNGGDGLAISRILLNKGYSVEPFVIKVEEKGSEDFEINFIALLFSPESLSHAAFQAFFIFKFSNQKFCFHEKASKFAAAK